MRRFIKSSILTLEALLLLLPGCGTDRGKSGASTLSSQSDPAVAAAPTSADADYLQKGKVVATPTFSPAGGTISGETAVTVSCKTSGAAIYYTLDGTTPTNRSTAYAAPIGLDGSKNVTIKAKAFLANMTASAVASAQFTAAASPPSPAPSPTITGWLSTSGKQIMLDGQPWMGRGVNMDDLFLCGFNNTAANPTIVASNLTTIADEVIKVWGANFIRVSLAMNSFNAVSWIDNPAQYANPMIQLINAIGANPGVYVLVTLRSEKSMVETGGGEPTYVPTNNTDALYVALVDSFAKAPYVMFGLSNEPANITPENLVPVMSHAVSVIRAEEDRLGVPHHIVSVQGNNWTSNISFYSTTPLPYDNVAYEIHGYPPANYTYANIPVIIGEYGPSSSGFPASFFDDVEAKGIPNLAWDLDPYNNCAPDLVSVNNSATNLQPSSWGTTVKAYLATHTGSSTPPSPTPAPTSGSLTVYDGETVPFSASSTWDSNGSTLVSSIASPYSPPNHLRATIKEVNYWGAAAYAVNNWSGQNWSGHTNLTFYAKANAATDMYVELTSGSGPTVSAQGKLSLTTSYTKFSIPLSTLSGVDLTGVTSVVFAVSNTASAVTYTVDVDNIVVQ